MSKTAENPEQQNIPVDEATKFFLGARSALKIGDMGAAERLLRRALDLSPKNYLYMLALARLLVQMDKNQAEAEKLLLDSSEVDANAVEPRLILSAVYEKQGQKQITVAILKSVINLDPTNFVARRKLTQLNSEFPLEIEKHPFRDEVLAQCSLVAEDLIPLVTQVPLIENEITSEVKQKPETFSVVDSVPIKVDTTPLVDQELLDEEDSDFGRITAEILAADMPESLMQEPEIDDPQILPTEGSVFDSPDPVITTNNDVWSSSKEETVVEVLRLEPDKLIIIIRRFFYAVKDQLGRENAFLLLTRSKQQIEAIYPELDYFELQEDYKIIEFVSNEDTVGKRTLEAIATWVYLYMILLKETSILREEAREKALEQALIVREEVIEEKIFQQYFSNIQI
jgi:tetratricopeptide (TPR) repeat protein